VLVLGDSYVEALQVDLEDTFLARLERVLGIEMINAGVSGYSTDNELRAFARYSDRVRPDAVLLVLFVGNDVLENGPRLFLKNPHGLPPKPWLGLGEGPGPLARCYAVARGAAEVADHVPDLLWTTSRLLRWTLTGGVGAALSAGCRDATGPPLIPGQLELFGVYGRPQTVAWEEAWAVTERTLHDLVTRVRDADMQVGIVLAPWQVEYDPSALLRPFFPPAAGGAWDYGYPYARLGALLTTWSVPWVSLEPALASHYAATGRSGAYAWDGHWNAEGHAVVADALEPFVTTLVGDRR
jgi:lysophospholipase L1-like esterase